MIDSDSTRRQFLIASMAATSLSLIDSSPPSCFGVASAKDVPWLASVQTPPTDVKRAPLPSLMLDTQGKPITSLRQWGKKRSEIERWWRAFLQPLNLPEKTPTLTVVKEDRVEGVLRQLVRYTSEPGITVEGYLLKPIGAKRDGSCAGIVDLHSTTNHTIHQAAGVSGHAEQAFGLKLAKAGMVSFCPKCFLWVGEGKFDQRVAGFHKRHPRSKGMAKMLYDAQLAVSILQTQPEVDRDRIGCVGHSLGAKEVLYLAAFDQRVKATVSSEGGVSVRFSNWNAPWYLGKGIDEKEFTRDHHELISLIAPRPFLLIGGDSADGDQSWPFIEAAMPVYRLHQPTRRPPIGLFNHRKGHAVPPSAESRIAEWLQIYLA